jgi:hypothetical protein
MKRSFKWIRDRDTFWCPGTRRQEIAPAFTLPVWETVHYDLVRWKRTHSAIAQNGIVLFHRLPAPFERLAATHIKSSCWDRQGHPWAW